MMLLEQPYSIWIKKYSTLVQQNTSVSKLEEIKKLKERIEELEFVKDFQQDIIADIYGNHYWCRFVKKVVAQNISKIDRTKEKNYLKENGSISGLGLVNNPNAKNLKHYKSNKWYKNYGNDYKLS